MASQLHISAVSPFGGPSPARTLSYPKGTIDSLHIRSNTLPPPPLVSTKSTFYESASRTRATALKLGNGIPQKPQHVISGVAVFNHPHVLVQPPAMVSVPNSAVLTPNAKSAPSSASAFVEMNTLSISKGADIHQRPTRAKISHSYGSSTQRAATVTSSLTSNSGIFSLQAVGASMPIVGAVNVAASFPPPLPQQNAVRGYRMSPHCAGARLDCFGVLNSPCVKSPVASQLSDPPVNKVAGSSRGDDMPVELEPDTSYSDTACATAPACATPARGSALAAVRAKSEGDSSACKSLPRAALPKVEAAIDISELVTDDVKGVYVAPDWETEAKCRKALKFKSTVEHREMMAKGCARKGIDYSSHVVSSVGGTVVRNAAKAMGFAVNEDEESTFFDFKWTVCHDDIPYGALNDSQLVNHYEKSAHELGSKIGLLKNVQCLQWFDHIAYQKFVPRTFNLSNPWELEDFIDDYLMTMAASFVIKSSLGINVDPAALDAAISVVQRRWAKNKHALPPLTLTDYFAMLPDEVARWNVKNIARIGTSAASAPPCTSPSRRMLSPQKGVSTVKKALHFDAEVSLSAAEPVVSSNPSVEDERKKQVQDALSNLEEHWSYHGSDGHHNAWIIKPGHSSRGRGIKCMSNLLDIMKYCLKRKHATIVQKYVETPMLLSAKKFDIRMWICVTDWNPMTIWAFDPCYLRICVQDHTLSDLEDVYKHLCNRCVQVKSGQYVGTEAEAASAAGGAKEGQKNSQKSKKKEEEDSGSDDDDEEGDVGVHMWDSQQFKEFLDQKYGAASRTWEDNLRPAMWKIAAQTMHAVQDVVKHRKNSFEWFGFDFLIDESLQPWLLEVNISPDMSLATDVLQRVVPLGVTDLMGMYFPDQKQPGATSLDAPPKDTDPRWSLIFKGKTVPNEVSFEPNSCFIRLIVGQILQKRHWLKKSKLAAQRAGRVYCNRNALIPKFGAEAYSTCITVDKE
jgi:tubulin monoglycylase TTLL3/8